MYGSQRRGLRSAATSSATAGTSGSSEAGSSQQYPSTSAAAIASQISQVQLVDEGSSDNDEGEDYGDMHKLILQGVMSAGFLDAKGVKKLFQEACKQTKSKVPAQELTSPPFIQKVVREINQRIKVYDMMIRSATCEVTGEKFYVFLVTIEKPIMKSQSYFTKAELELFQKILDSILQKHRNFTISMNECVNIGGELDARTFSKSSTEDFVEKMMSLQYFTKSIKHSEENCHITLGFRTIREFEPIFRDMYPDVFASCCLCKLILLNGLQCPKCPAVIHRKCLSTYMRNCKMCVNCKCTWKSEKTLVTRVNSNVDEPGSSQQGTPSKTGKTRSSQETSQSGKPEGNLAKRTRLLSPGEEVDMPVLEPMVSPESAGKSQSRGRSAKKAKESPAKDSRNSTPSSASPTKNLPSRGTRESRRRRVAFPETDSE